MLNEDFWQYGSHQRCTSGIGLELAARLSKLGNQVIVTGRNRASLDAVTQRLPEISVRQSDVADVKAIAELHREVLTEFPRLNVIVNNAGIMRKINLHTFGADLDDITREIDITLRSHGPKHGGAQPSYNVDRVAKAEELDRHGGKMVAVVTRLCSRGMG